MGKIIPHKTSFTPRERFQHYRSNAGRVGHKFDLSFHEFCKLWRKPCAYCGDPIETIGIDRVDSEKGYEVGNVLPCCKVCNRMKTNTPLGEFLNQCRKITAKTWGMKPSNLDHSEDVEK
jgi:hypothetical protein